MGAGGKVVERAGTAGCDWRGVTGGEEVETSRCEESWLRERGYRTAVRAEGELVGKEGGDVWRRLMEGMVMGV